MCNALGGYLANDAVHVSSTAIGGCIAYAWTFAGQNANGTPLTIGPKGATQGAGGFCSAYMDTGLGLANCPTTAGTGTGTQTANSTQAFGYLNNPSTSKCDYEFGITGNVDQNNSRGTWSNYKNISGTSITSGTAEDLSTITTYGDCVARLQLERLGSLRYECIFDLSIRHDYNRSNLRSHQGGCQLR